MGNQDNHLRALFKQEMGEEILLRTLASLPWIIAPLSPQQPIAFTLLLAVWLQEQISILRLTAPATVLTLSRGNSDLYEILHCLGQP